LARIRSIKLLGAELASDDHIIVRLNRSITTTAVQALQLIVRRDDGQQISIREIKPAMQRLRHSGYFHLHLDLPTDWLGHRYQVVLGKEAVELRLSRLLADPSRFYDADRPLGLEYGPSESRFRVFAPTAQAAWLVIADEVEGEAGKRDLPMHQVGSGLWEAAVEGDHAGRYYAYRFQGLGHDEHREITDIYATCTQARHARSLIVDLNTTDPAGFRDHQLPHLRSPVDAVIYEVHVRDFSIAAESNHVHRGNYLALTESGRHVKGHPDVPVGIEHLEQLGITHVQLMPVQDFDNDETTDDGYRWGYMPVHFNSPDGWYASSPDGACKISELKQLIQSLHERGIGVIMDVVYNHTSPVSSFEAIVPGYYHRQLFNGHWANGSGCGNEFRSEAPMARRFIIDSLKYWVSHYRVDGFRFDLMALHDRLTMLAIERELRKLRPDILLYGEPWTAAATPLPIRSTRERLRGSGIGAFNDHFRDAIKGNLDDESPGFIQAGWHGNGVVDGLQAAIHNWSDAPSRTINYFECHDNMTAWDKLSISVDDENADTETLMQMSRFAAFILMISQGIIFLHAGQEFCRTKQGHHNSYNLPEEINRIDWMRKIEFKDVHDYYRGMIALRKAHPALRLRDRAEIERRLRFWDPPSDQCLICHIDATEIEGEPAAQILLLCNADERAIRFDLPDGSWRVWADATRASDSPLGQAGAHAILPARSGMLLTADS
jgi:pullulanase